jgi:hypothetical protein
MAAKFSFSTLFFFDLTIKQTKLQLTNNNTKRTRRKQYKYTPTVRTKSILQVQVVRTTTMGEQKEQEMEPNVAVTKTNTKTVVDQQQEDEEQREDFADKIFQAVLGAQLVLTAYVGYTTSWAGTRPWPTIRLAIRIRRVVVAVAVAVRRPWSWLTPPNRRLVMRESGWNNRPWRDVRSSVTIWPKKIPTPARTFRLPLAHAGVLTDGRARHGLHVTIGSHSSVMGQAG